MTNAEALDYIKQHEMHFGKPPSAILGDEELREDMKRWYDTLNESGYLFGVNTKDPQYDKIFGVPILWADAR